MKLKRRTKEGLVGFSFISLWLVGFLVFTLIPLIRTAYLSFNSVRITSAGIRSTSIGLKNYNDAFFTDVEFVDKLLTYLGELVIYIPIILVFSLGMAIMLNMDIKFKGLFRTIFFLPVIITSGPVLQKLTEKGAMTIPMIQEIVESGIITDTLPGALGGLAANVLSSFISILWFSGVPILVFITGLQKMDKAVYEAASIDGASKWQTFWKVTLPAINPMIMINIIYTIVTVSVLSMNEVIIHIQNRSFDDKWGLGYASALSWIYFVVLLMVLGLFLLLVKPKKDKKRTI
ncbi:MAG: carbohydrate ABC transporter permease [Clostridiaceae bacterium]